MQNINPIEQNQRTAIVDILRGWALLGVVLVNYSLFFSFRNNSRIPGNDIVSLFLQQLVSIIFATKCWTMLSFLFGYGFSALIKNIELKGIDPVPLFSRRMFWLLIIAFINSCLYYGDILKDYALMGMIILLFYRISAKTSLCIAIFLLLLIPAVSVYAKSLHFTREEPGLYLYQSHNFCKVLWFGLRSGINVILSVDKLLTWNLVMLACAFMGQFVQKTGYFNRMAKNKKPLKRIFWSALAFAFFLAIIHFSNSTLNFEKYYDLEYWFKLCLMIIIMSALCWLYVSQKLKRFFKAMQITGRMTLTNYLVQNFIALFLFSGFGFGLLHKLSYSYYILLAFTVYIAQIYFSIWWLSKYHYGPVEWLWRQLSYGKKLALLKKPIKLLKDPKQIKQVTFLKSEESC